MPARATLLRTVWGSFKGAFQKAVLPLGLMEVSQRVGLLSRKRSQHPVSSMMCRITCTTSHQEAPQGASSRPSSSTPSITCTQPTGSTPTRSHFLVLISVGSAVSTSLPQFPTVSRLQHTPNFVRRSVVPKPCRTGFELATQTFVDRCLSECPVSRLNKTAQHCFLIVQAVWIKALSSKRMAVEDSSTEEPHDVQPKRKRQIPVISRL